MCDIPKLVSQAINQQLNMIPHITRPDLCVFLEVMNVFIGGTDTTMGVHRNRSWNNWSDKVPQN